MATDKALQEKVNSLEERLEAVEQFMNRIRETFGSLAGNFGGTTGTCLFPPKRSNKTDEVLHFNNLPNQNSVEVNSGYVQESQECKVELQGESLKDNLVENTEQKADQSVESPCIPTNNENADDVQHLEVVIDSVLPAKTELHEDLLEASSDLVDIEFELESENVGMETSVLGEDRKLEEYEDEDHELPVDLNLLQQNKCEVIASVNLINSEANSLQSHSGPGSTKLFDISGRKTVKKKKRWLPSSGRTLQSCTICGKVVLKSNIREHVKTHTSLKRWACDFCGERFTRKYSCNRHKRRCEANRMT